MSVVVKLFMRFFSPVRRSDAAHGKHRIKRRDVAVARHDQRGQAEQSDRLFVIEKEKRLFV
jgi:hypothetical protein